LVSLRTEAEAWCMMLVSAGMSSIIFLSITIRAKRVPVTHLA